MLNNSFPMFCLFSYSTAAQFKYQF
jgi:hypothetical protein